MRTSRSLLVLFALLVLSLGLAFPAEDVLETVYDEYEALPYEATPLFSAATPKAAVSTIKPSQSSGCLQPAPIALTLARNTEPDAHRARDERVALALLCTLLC